MVLFIDPFPTVFYYYGKHPLVIHFNPLIRYRFHRGHGILTRMDRIVRAQHHHNQSIDSTLRSWPGKLPSLSPRVLVIEFVLLATSFDKLATRMSAALALGFQWFRAQFSAMISCVLRNCLGLQRLALGNRNVLVHCHARVRLRGGAGIAQCKLPD